MDLSGKKVFVAGGTGAVGEGIVRVLLKHGATVMVSSRNPDNINKLKEYVGNDGNLLTTIGDISTPDGVSEVFRWVKEVSPKLDGIVASVGSWWQGPPIYEVDYETYLRVLENRLHPHFLLLKTFIPYLMEQGFGTYITLGGTHAETPFPKSSLVSISGAAQLMMSKIIFEELKDTKVRFIHLLLGVVNTRKVRDRAGPDWITAEEVGEFISFLFSDMGRMVSNTVIRLPARPPI